MVYTGQQVSRPLVVDDPTIYVCRCSTNDSCSSVLWISSNGVSSDGQCPTGSIIDNIIISTEQLPYNVSRSIVIWVFDINAFKKADNWWLNQCNKYPTNNIMRMHVIIAILWWCNPDNCDLLSHFCKNLMYNKNVLKIYWVKICKLTHVLIALVRTEKTSNQYTLYTNGLTCLWRVRKFLFCVCTTNIS